MPTHVARPLCLILVIALSINAPAKSQQSSDSPSPSAPAPKTSATAPSTSVKKSRGPLSDYVPCLFSDDEQFDMRAQVAPKQPLQVLDVRAAQQLLDATRVALSPTLAQYRQQSPDFLKDFYAQFDQLMPDALVGMTSDQANAHIQAAIVKAVEDAATKQKVNGKYLESDTLLQKNRTQAATTIDNVVANTISALPPPKSKAPKTQDEFIEAAKAAILKANGLSANYLQAVHDSFRPDKPMLDELPPSRWPDYLAYAAKQAAMNVTQDPLPQTDAVNTSDAEESSLKAVLAASTNQVVSETEGKTAVQQFQPPNDVSCSMSVMTWKETSDIFGRRVANTFVAIQVTLRNLNNKNEFLVHDIQVAIDTGVSQAYFGRFQAGRDRLLVRAVAQRGQSEDRRNLIVNTLQAAGAIAAAGSIATGSVSAKDAVAVFQGAFIPGFANIFPDHTVEQLNHINDLVFSASNTSKVLVPIQGSVPLVTFISEKPIEQLPFAWCGHPPGGSAKRWLGSNLQQICEFNQDARKSVSNSPFGSEPVGSTSDRSSAAAGNTENLDNAGYVAPYQYNDGKVNLGDVNNVQPWPDLRYKDWRSAALRMLQEHTFVVVGGIHIQEVVTQPKIANLDCQRLTGGQIDISQLKDGMVSCTVTGSGLGLVSEVSFEKGSTKIVGKIKASSDGNSATLEFKPDDMCDTEGLYSLYLTYKSNSEKDATHIDSGESASLTKEPSVTGAKLLSNTLTITGKCLDQLVDASLAPVGTANAIKGSDFAVKSPSEATATFSTLADQTNYYLIYTIKNQQNKPIEARSITVMFQKVTGGQSAVPPKPASKKPAAKP